jgi:SAM-dependent methyltransferase
MDATEFRRASHAAWEAMAAGLDDRYAWFEETTRPVTERMLEHLAPAPAHTVLDLAAGVGVTGLGAAALVGPDGRVIVSDFSEAMVAVAERHARGLGIENVAFRVLDAERIELADDTVDGVLCRWGYMLMADQAAALAETYRVLRRGGRLSCAVLGDPQQNPWAALPAGVLQERGHMPPPQAGAPGIFALADRERLRGLLAQAGFSEPQIDEVPFTWRFAGDDDYWDFLTRAAGAIALVLDRLEEDERARVRHEIAERAAPFADGDGIALPALALVASGS